MNNNRRFFKTWYVVIITVVITLLVLVLGLNIFLKNLPFSVSNLIRLGKIVDSTYVGEYDADKVEENVMNAIVMSIDDKYAVYYNEENAEQTMNSIEGYYTGIGVEVFANTEKDKIEVISAFEGTPADKAGMKSGDLIVSVDGKEYSSKELADAVIYMKGIKSKKPLEEELSVVVLRGEKLLELKLKRERIELYEVKSEIIDDVCYIRYPGFTKNSAEKFNEILNGLGDNIRAVVVDVRDNPGGELKSAINMCDSFLEDEMIMYTVDKKGRKTEYYATRGSSTLPLAVIVNGASASASEIFAGSLKANNRAIIVGEKTFGKGVTQTVQYINPLDTSVGAVKITAFKNFTPDGKWINESILPDIEVITDKNVENIREDAAFKAAVDSLKGKMK